MLARSNHHFGDNAHAEDGTQSKSPFEALYGPQVANELTLIEQVLDKTASSLGCPLTEGDLDSFCRERSAKITRHSLQKGDEQFERVRLLNMMYEGCLSFLDEAAAAFAGQDAKNGEKTARRAGRIIEHLRGTLDHSAGKIADDLSALYEFANRHLKLALAERSAGKTREVREIISKIYSGYLELELKQDAAKFLEERKARGAGEGLPT